MSIFHLIVTQYYFDVYNSFDFQEEDGGPKVKGFEHHTLQIDWHSPHACGTRISQPDSGGRSWLSKLMILYVTRLYLQYLVVI